MLFGKNMIQGLWFALILIMLLLSVTGLPGAFIGVLVVFYVPMILGILYLIWEIIGPIWFSVAFMGCFLFKGVRFC